MHVLLFALLSLAAQAQTPVSNSGFEQGEPGAVPPNWSLPSMLKDTGFRSETVAEGCRTGSKCAQLSGVENPPPNMFGNLIQSVGAGGYNLRRVRLSAAVRVEGAATRAQMWLRLDRADNSMVFLDNMGQRPITSSEWKTYQIETNVTEDASRLVFGVMLFGAGKAYVDDVKLEPLGEIRKDPVETARPLTSRGLTNVTAFARLYGYIRFFHPSDEASRADWETVAIEGVRAVEDAASDAELMERLRKSIASVAPTVRIGPSAAPVEPASGATEITRLTHVGVGLPSTTIGFNVYNSKRVKKAVGEQRPPYIAVLAPGVVATIPVDLPVDAKGTLPHAPPAAELPIYERVPEDRATRFGAVLIAWNIFQHFYPYFDVVKTDWNAELGKALQAAATDGGRMPFLHTLRRMVAALKDGHGNVFTRQGMSMLRLPLTLDFVEGQLIVSRVWPGLSEGVSAGDRIVSLDGVPVAKATAGVFATTSGATEGWIRYRAAGELSVCPAGAKTMKLAIEPYAAPSTTKALELTCGPGKFKDQATYTETRPEKMKELEPGLWYVDLDRVNDADWKTLIPKLEQAKGIVFDMRGYPGAPGITALAHLSDNPLRSAKWNIPEAALPDRKEFPFKESGWPVPPAKPYFAAPRVFLIDGRAISYAETVMGIVEHFKLAEIVGEPTAGTNGNVNPFTVPGGYNIAWTGMKVLKHDGSQHHGIGILPTVKATRTRKGVAEGKDEVLQKGLEVVKRKIQ